MYKNIHIQYSECKCELINMNVKSYDGIMSNLGVSDWNKYFPNIFGKFCPRSPPVTVEHPPMKTPHESRVNPDPSGTF